VANLIQLHIQWKNRPKSPLRIEVKNECGFYFAKRSWIFFEAMVRYATSSRQARASLRRSISTMNVILKFHNTHVLVLAAQ
jgi:hypothetical protein